MRHRIVGWRGSDVVITRHRFYLRVVQLYHANHQASASDYARPMPIGVLYTSASL